MPTLTTKLSLNKPLVNNATDEDLWGTQLNANMDTLDAAMTPVLLSTVNASGAASVTFNSTYIASPYANFLLEMYGVYCSVNATDLRLTFSVDNGSNYLSTDYRYHNMQVSGSGDVSGDGSGSASYIQLLSSAVLLSNTAAQVSAGTLRLYGLLTAVRPVVLIDVGNIDGRVSGVGSNLNDPTVNAMKLVASSGNLTGTFKLYGF